MTRKNTSRILFIGLFLFFSFFIYLNVHAAYDFINSSGANLTAQQTGHSNQAIFSAAPGGLEGGISTVITMLLSFLGVIFLILMIYAGILWMTALGNDQKVGRAKDIMIRSIIGLIIVVAAYAISYYLVGVFVGQTLSNASF